MRHREKAVYTERSFGTTSCLRLWNGAYYWGSPQAVVGEKPIPVLTETVVMDDNVSQRPYPLVSPLDVLSAKREYTDSYRYFYNVRLWSKDPARDASKWPSLSSAVPNPPSGLGSGLYESALEKIESEDPGRQALQGIPFVAELRKSVDMMRNPFGFLVDAINPILKAKSRKKKKKILFNKDGTPASMRDVLIRCGFSASSNAWLSYTYGWSLFFQDLLDSAVQLAKVKEQYAEYVRNAREGSPIQMASSTASSSSYQKATSTSGFASDYSAEHTSNAKLWYRFRPSANVLSKGAFIRSKFGLTPAGAAQAAWELVPYSFVADWFIPIGKVLTKMTETPCNMQVLEQQYSITTVVTRKARYIQNPIGGYPSVNFGLNPLYTDTARKYTRRKNIPSSDGGDSWFTTKRAVSALALIAQRLKLPLLK